MTRPLRFVVAFAAAAALSSCANEVAPTSGESGQDTSQQTAAGSEGTQAPSHGRTLEVAAFADRVGLADTVVLDVRTPEEFAQGHLEGAINIDVGAADFADQVADLPVQDRYAVYCRTGARSAQAMQTMLDQGFADVAHLDGGIGAWEASGGDVVSSP